MGIQLERQQTLYPLPTFTRSTMAVGGVLLRFGAVGLRIIQFGCAAIVLGIYSYYLAVLAQHDIHIPTWEKAVTGMSGAGALYTIFGIIFTLCLGGVAFFGFLAVVLDICFAGCFAAIAYYTRHRAFQRVCAWRRQLWLRLQPQHRCIRCFHCQHHPLPHYRRLVRYTGAPSQEGEALRPQPLQQLHFRLWQARQVLAAQEQVYSSWHPRR